MNDYYYILGLKKDANQQDIKVAYRKLSKKFHPDVNPNDSFFEERFKEIQNAYEILSNSTKKTEYDRNTGNYTKRKTENDRPAEKSAEQARNEENLRKEQVKQQQKQQKQRERQKRQEEENRRNKEYEKQLRKTENQKTFGCIFGVLILFIAIGILIDGASNDKVDGNKKEENYTTNSQISKDFFSNGLYIGNIHQFDNSENWEIELEVNKEEKIFKVKYPSLNCGGKWELISESNNVLQFRENIERGQTNCVNLIKIIIEEINDELVCRFYYPNSTMVNAKGILIKKQISETNSKTTPTNQFPQSSYNGNLNSQNSNQNSQQTNTNASSDKYSGNKLNNGDSPLDNCFGKGRYGGKAYLVFDNSNSTDAIVCLVNQYDGKTIRNEYIRAGDEFKMTQIPSGNYYLKVCYGNDWNPEKENFCGTNGAFQRNVHYSKSDNFGDTIEIENSAYSFTTGSITLYAVQNGNMSSENINESTFFNE